MQNKQWSQKERELLERCYSVCTADELQILLVRFSKKQIRAQANKMNLKKSETIRKFIHAENGKRNIHAMHTDNAKEKKKNSICEMVRKERLRLKYGLPQKTKRVFSAVSKVESAKNARRSYNLKHKGYYLDWRNKVLYYWDSITQRTARTEAFYKKIGFKIINDPEQIQLHIGIEIKPHSTII